MLSDALAEQQTWIDEAVRQFGGDALVVCVGGENVLAVDGYNQSANTVPGSLRTKNDADHTGVVVYPTIARSLTARHDGSPCDNRGMNIVAFHLTQDPISDEDVTPCISSGNPNNGQATVGVVYCIQGNIVDRSDTAGAEGIGVTEGVSYTLNTVDRHAVCFDTTQITSPQNGSNPRQGDPCHPLAASAHPPLLVCAFDPRGNGNGAVCPTMTGDHNGHISDYTTLAVCAVDYRNFREHVELSDTLQCKSHSLNHINPIRIGYIVRRLTPTECARLQGFADNWGHLPQITDMSDDEYFYWLDVRSTFARINGKKVKMFSRKAMVNWYNKLHSDGAEYKMWGNGVALPCVRWVIGRVKEVLAA